MSTKIHPTAVVDSGAQLGEGVEVGPHVVIYNHTTIGAHTKIHAGAVIGDTPQDLAFKNVVSHVQIGEHCVIREHVTIHRGTKEGSVTNVGNNCYLMANAHLAHNVQLNNNVILANGVLLAGYVEVGDRAFISGNTVVHQFCRIGRLAMVSGLGAFSKDIPPFCMTRTNAHNAVIGLNVVGMRRAGLKPEERSEIKAIFNVLYRSNFNVKQALEKIRSEHRSGVAQEFCAFVEASKRGICRLDSDVESDSDDLGS